MKSGAKLTEGKIVKSLINLALPIMGTSFIQMAYNMTDMIWIGRLGSSSVAAVGTAGFFTWLAMAFILIPKIGAEIGVSQSIGSNDKEQARCYARCSIQIAAVLALFYSIFLIVFRKNLIGFFGLGEEAVVDWAMGYLSIISLGMVFYFLNPVFTGIFNGYGDSRAPFWVNAAGLLTNIVLDPLLIFGLGPFPEMGVNGTAIATVISQVVAFTLFIYMIKIKTDLLVTMNIFRTPKIYRVKRIFTLGMPIALENGLFTIFTMIVARVVAQWGSAAIAVQKVGAQVEAISWMTSVGFSTALGAFTGQNYGAGKAHRITRGFFASMGMVSAVGAAATFAFVFWAEPIFKIFINEKEALLYGADYLRILGYSQILMCIEITASGAFNGIGKTLPPSIVGIVFTGMRVPFAMWAASKGFGLNAIWWIFSMTSIIKGIILFVWFIPQIKRGYGLGESEKGDLMEEAKKGIII
ncbi:putative efflux protein, MATE family [Peptoclostridium litorale DSM 5388]|uniref:Probable multidrug resistance protein NorM n=2 Tax=Peptoclostridium litorale TaxID=1557 RepID=A0A069RI32_PEPLI|nr:MATE family efflux transporter [Peptoclostridium litorale]KDR96684.1 putative multidrug resistance protein NorM [Peptoclostridium litorale DSM 5388]SIN67753.1 putative efflux protein, MATE family [Peptoclostridium litorale DSM 5388]